MTVDVVGLEVCKLARLAALGGLEPDVRGIGRCADEAQVAAVRGPMHRLVLEAGEFEMPDRPPPGGGDNPVASAKLFVVEVTTDPFPVRRVGRVVPTAGVVRQPDGLAAIDGHLPERIRTFRMRTRSQ